MYHKYLSLNDMQRDWIIKSIIGTLTRTLVIASIFKILYETLSSEMLMSRDYLMSLPVLLILLPAIKRTISNYPITCYQVKGALSVIGILSLAYIELMDIDRIWYLIDVAIISFMPLLTTPHRSYYQSRITNNCKVFSDVYGSMEVLGIVLNITLGLWLVWMDIPVLCIILVVLVLEVIERAMEIRIAKWVWA